MIGLRDLDTFPWTSLRAFEAASRLGSFKAAARELSVTPTAISHQIKRLETHLGLPLFERLHRSLQLTAAGQTLAAEAQDAFARLRQALVNLRADAGGAGSQTLTVSAVPSLAAKWLAPRLHEFQAAHPRITLRIVADETVVDLRRDRVVDVALRYGPGPYGDSVHAERLWEKGALIAVCAPEVAKDLSLRTPAGLVRHMLIRTASPASSRRTSLHADWRAWLTALGVPMDAALEKALGGPLFSASQLAIEAAAAGKGIALAPTVLVERDIASGRLAQLFQVSVPDANAYWLVCRIDRLEEARIRTFMKWIRAQAVATDSPPPRKRRT